MEAAPKYVGLLALAISTSCDAPKTVSSEGDAPKTESLESDAWHFSGFAEVRAYRLNWNDEYAFDGIISRDGELNATRIPADGVILDQSQLQRLETAVTGSHPSHPVAACFYPHHAFVFFDSLGSIVGHMDVCFLCSNYRGTPEGFADNWDLDALQALIKALGMPIQNGKWD